MSSDERDRLDRIENLVEENNAMLRKMLSIARWARVARIVYWLILIGAAVGAFYYIQPVLDQVLETYKDILGTFQKN